MNYARVIKCWTPYQTTCLEIIVGDSEEKVIDKAKESLIKFSKNFNKELTEEFLKECANRGCYCDSSVFATYMITIDIPREIINV